MKVLLALVTLFAMLKAMNGEEQKQGPRGGCYTIQTSKKSGKTYKRYQKCQKAVK